MGPQNLNNYFFNKLDAHIDYSSYYDFFLASDEKDYNMEVIYSKSPIGVQGNESFLKTGKPFSSSKLGVWFDLSKTGCTKYFNLDCNKYYSDNTLLSLSYWDEARPNKHDVLCRCIKCETRHYSGNTQFVESVCGIGLTGTDNGLVKYMKEDPTICDFCKVSFTANTTFIGTVTGSTIGSTKYFTPTNWSSNIINPPPSGPLFEFPYMLIGGVPTVSYTAKTSNNNLTEFNCDNVEYVTCCFFTGGTAYKFTLKEAWVTIPNSGGVPNGVFTASTMVEKGYWKVPCGVESIKLWETLPSKYEHHPLHYDKRLKMHAVTGYTNNSYDYNIVSVTGSCAGQYQELDGGFYQGFFKLHDYEYEALPARTECGWTVDCLLKVRQNPDICSNYENTLNSKYPNNAGFFWYMGTRAENKFWNVFSGESGVTTCDNMEYSCSGETLPIQRSKKVQAVDACNNKRTIFQKWTYPNIVDSMSNSFGLRLTPDYRLGYRALYYTGSCIMTGTCVTGYTYTTGYTISEKYTTKAICGLSGSTQIGQEPWLEVTARFKRDYCFEGCDLENYGGVNDLREIVTQGVAVITSKVKEKTTIDFNKLWLDEINFRRGTLTLFVNGRPVLEVPNFEEVIPRRLNTEPELQVGVPYNMSWGGGSQGLIESLTFISGNTCYPYQQDNKDLGLLIEKNFAGTFDGGISQMRYYLEPLSNDEIIHNYLVDKNRYNLVDCRCNFTECRPGQVLYLTEGDSLYISLEFDVFCTETGFTGDTCMINKVATTGYTSNPVLTLAVNRLDHYLSTGGWSGVKFTNAITDNISSYSMYIHSEMGHGAEKSVTFPFCAGPNDVVKIVINKINDEIDSKMVIYGNYYK